MKTEIKIETNSDGNLVIDVYLNGKWFKQINPEGLPTITETLNCVAESLKKDEDFNMYKP